MASISPISSTGPLQMPCTSANRPPSTPEPQCQPVAGNPDPVESLALTGDQVILPAGSGALTRVATTSLWSLDFELPSDPVVVAPAKTPWISQVSAVPSRSEAPARFQVEREDEDDFDLIDLLALPMEWAAKAVGAGVGLVQGVVTAASEAAGQVSLAVGTGLQRVAGAIGNGVQQAASAIGRAATNAWKAISGFRWW